MPTARLPLLWGLAICSGNEIILRWEKDNMASIINNEEVRVNVRSRDGPAGD
jgi:hypothetical protein